MSITCIFYINVKGSHQKNVKKFTHCANYGGHQILVCEPQKSDFFRANFPKKNMLKLIHIVPFVCLYKIQSLNSLKIPDVGFHLYILPFIVH